MINPQWNTPPNGDFASYVERLSAQAALPKRAPAEGQHGLDVGMTPATEAHAGPGVQTEAQAAARRSTQSNGEASAVADKPAQGVIKILGIVWAGVLLLLLASGVSFAIVVGVFVAGLWLAHRLRRWVLPPGTANWQQWLEDMARKQQQQRRGK